MLMLLCKYFVGVGVSLLCGHARTHAKNARDGVSSNSRASRVDSTQSDEDVTTQAAKEEKTSLHLFPAQFYQWQENQTAAPQPAAASRSEHSACVDEGRSQS